MSYGHAIDIIDLTRARTRALDAGSFTLHHRFADGAVADTKKGREESVAELATRLNDLGVDMAGEPTFEPPERRGAGAAVLRVSVAVRARDQAWTPTLPS